MFATRLTPAWFLLALLPLVVFAQAPPPAAGPRPLRPPSSPRHRHRIGPPGRTGRR
jgi:hypothetical protein